MIHHLTSDKARELIADLDGATQRIAEYLWVNVYGYSEKNLREWVDEEPFDGQWNYCIEMAKKLSYLFEEMFLEAVSY